MAETLADQHLNLNNMNKQESKQFDFGANWKEYSEKRLSPERIEAAWTDFQSLTKDIEFKDKSFLDIGFGQGLSLMAATRAGARTVGNDINPTCKQVLEHNRKAYPGIGGKDIPVVVGSILEESTVDALLAANNGKAYDIVHSWGVLHHTGHMQKALDNASKLLAPGGHLIIAIYNRHWTSRFWWYVKNTYVYAPRYIQKAMIWLFYPPFYLRILLQGKNPKDRDRGMDFYYDLVDWVGGYPYEYASDKEMTEWMKKRGFSKRASYPPPGHGTGCVEYVFKKTKEQA